MPIWILIPLSSSASQKKHDQFSTVHQRAIVALSVVQIRGMDFSPRWIILINYPHKQTLIPYQLGDLLSSRNMRFKAKKMSSTPGLWNVIRWYLMMKHETSTLKLYSDLERLALTSVAKYLCIFANLGNMDTLWSRRCIWMMMNRPEEFVNAGCSAEPACSVLHVVTRSH